MLYRAIKRVDLEPVLPTLDRLKFVRVHGGVSKYPCDVVLASSFTKELHSFIAGLGLGGELARAVLRRLGPRQHIPPHIDDWMPKEADWRRFQIPLISHPDIKMRWPDDGVEVHLEPGYLYEVRFDRMHEVVNNADCYRIHLQLDQVNATI